MAGAHAQLRRARLIELRITYDLAFDRVAHKAHIVDMTGESYRVLETEEWMKGVTEATSVKN